MKVDYVEFIVVLAVFVGITMVFASVIQSFQSSMAMSNHSDSSVLGWPGVLSCTLNSNLTSLPSVVGSAGLLECGVESFYYSGLDCVVNSSGVVDLNNCFSVEGGTYS